VEQTEELEYPEVDLYLRALKNLILMKINHKQAQVVKAEDVVKIYGSTNTRSNATTAENMDIMS
jgi:hypothetical protein